LQPKITPKNENFFPLEKINKRFTPSPLKTSLKSPSKKIQRALTQYLIFDKNKTQMCEICRKNYYLIDFFVFSNLVII